MIMATAARPWIESNYVTKERMLRRMVEQIDLIRQAALKRIGASDVPSFITPDHGHDSIEFWLYILHFNPHLVNERVVGNVVRDATNKGIKLELSDDVFLTIVPEHVDGRIAQYTVKVEGPRDQKTFIQQVLQNLTAEVVEFSD